MERAVFIINPLAGSKTRRNLRKKILKHIKGDFPEPLFFETDEISQATNIVKEKVKEGIRTFVAVGGDGTVNGVARGLVNTEASVGIIPVGSGNGLARHLGIPMNLSGAVEFLKNAGPVSVDYGLMNEMPFFCTAGIGFDALIGYKFSLLGNRGFFSYLGLILSNFLYYKPQRYNIRIDNSDKRENLLLLTFANSSQYGNRAVIAPRATISDGLLDVAMLYPFPFYRALDIGLRLLTKKIDSCNKVRIIKGKKISVERESQGYVHIDGEPVLMGKKIDVKIVPDGISILL